MAKHLLSANKKRVLQVSNSPSHFAAAKAHSSRRCPSPESPGNTTWNSKMSKLHQAQTIKNIYGTFSCNGLILKETLFWQTSFRSCCLIPQTLCVHDVAFFVLNGNTKRSNQQAFQFGVCVCVKMGGGPLHLDPLPCGFLVRSWSTSATSTLSANLICVSVIFPAFLEAGRERRVNSARVEAWQTPRNPRIRQALNTPGPSQPTTHRLLGLLVGNKTRGSRGRKRSVCGQRATGRTRLPAVTEGCYCISTRSTREMSLRAAHVPKLPSSPKRA